MSRLLTFIMSRAVPDARVESAWVTHVPWWDIRLYFIFVDPFHSDYWIQFKKRYPYWERVALKYGAKAIEAACPEFDSFENLMNWLFDVLILPQGERNLLQLLMKQECRC